MGFFRQEYWNGLLCPPAGDLPNPQIEPMSLKFLSLAGVFFVFVFVFTTSTTWEAQIRMQLDKVLSYLNFYKF